MIVELLFILLYFLFRSIGRMRLAGLRGRIIPVLRKYGVVRAAIFGSFARGEAGEGSDLDLLVEFEEDRSLLDLVGLKVELEDMLGIRVDVVTYSSLHPRIRERVLKEQEVIYEEGSSDTR